MRKPCLILLTSLCAYTHLQAADPVPESHFREIGQLDIDTYYLNLPKMLKENNWKKLAIIGETALEAAQIKGFTSQELEITDQLVSSYFKLGQFEKSLQHALHLRNIADNIPEKDKLANSFYKLSAVLRASADCEEDLSKKMEIFAASRSLIFKSLAIAEEYCPDDQYLHAKIYFNAGALEAQALDGDMDLAINYYEKAVSIFQENNKEEYLQRTLIRLAKAYILTENLVSAGKIIEDIEKQTMSPMTQMHFYTLQGTFFIEEKNKEQALLSLEKAKESAETLHAAQDLIRIEALIDKANSL